MNEEQFVWEHFKFNAEQRLKGFHFFIVFSTFLDGGVLAAIPYKINNLFLFFLGGFIMFVALAFYLIDKRSQNLLNITIPALKAIESSFQKEFQLFDKDSKNKDKIFRYTVAIRGLIFAQLFFGACVTFYSFMQMI